MRNRNKISKSRLKAIVNDCYDIINLEPSKFEALNKISDKALIEFGDYFGPYILKSPDKISMNFIELMDQIIFEIKENNQHDDNIKETIIEDLYLRVKINLEIIKGTDNIFADLGFDNPEEYKVKADLAMEINRIIKKRKLKQSDAAKIIDTTQVHVSKLKRGRLEGFSLERLIHFLNLLDRDVELVVKQKPSDHKVGVLHVAF